MDYAQPLSSGRPGLSVIGEPTDVLPVEVLSTDE